MKSTAEATESAFEQCSFDLRITSVFKYYPSPTNLLASDEAVAAHGDKENVAMICSLSSKAAVDT